MNLVYMCVFYNSKYIRLLELLFLSLRVFSSRDSFDLLILTSDDFQKEVRDLADRLEIPCKIHCIPCTSIFEAACSRLHVFDWPEIGMYKKILYLDTDIIVRRDISSLFSFELEDILYGELYLMQKSIP
jgi:lipopolysaccharide biosynthesis glycosyltransferase